MSLPVMVDCAASNAPTPASPHLHSSLTPGTPTTISKSSGSISTTPINNRPNKLQRSRRPRATSEPRSQDDDDPNSPSSSRTIPLAWRRKSIVDQASPSPSPAGLPDMPFLRHQISSWSLRGRKTGGSESTLSSPSKLTTKHLDPIFGGDSPSNITEQDQSNHQHDLSRSSQEKVAEYASEIPKKLSNWFNSLLSSSSSDVVDSNSTPPQKINNFPSRQNSTPRSRTIDRAIRYLLDTDASVSTSKAPAWILGVGHEMDRKSESAIGNEINPTSQGQGHSQTSTSSNLGSSSLPPSQSQPRERRFTMSSLRNSIGELSWPLEFYSDFTSRIWCTYRSGFPPIKPSNLCSDAGWGCMLRSGQSLLANTLITRHLGRQWRRPNPGDSLDNEQYQTYVNILRWFMDDMSLSCPFSIHRMTLIGKQMGKEIGEWFGPSTAAEAIRALVSNFPEAKLAVHVASDGVIYKKEVYKVASSTKDGTYGPTLILLGTRLGIDNVNPIYYEGLKRLLKLHQSMGIAGGRPSSSYYFVGVQEDELFYLDPHHTRPAPCIDNISENDIASFHCLKPRRMPLSHLDPSMLLGFLCMDARDFEEFCATAIKEMSKESGATPLFYIAEERPSFWNENGSMSDDDYDNAGVETFSEVEGVDVFSMESGEENVQNSGVPIEPYVGNRDNNEDEMDEVNSHNDGKDDKEFNKTLLIKTEDDGNDDRDTVEEVHENHQHGNVYVSGDDGGFISMSLPKSEEFEVEDSQNFYVPCEDEVKKKEKLSILPIPMMPKKSLEENKSIGEKITKTIKEDSSSHFVKESGMIQSGSGSAGFEPVEVGSPLSEGYMTVQTPTEEPFTEVNAKEARERFTKVKIRSRRMEHS